MSRYEKEKDPLFSVTQSSLGDKPFTIWDVVKEIPQYILAFTLYFDLCLLHYTIARTRGIVLVITLAFGLYTDDANRSIFSTACLIYSAHCLTGIAFLKVFLSDEKRLRWFYDHVGERRAKPKLFA